MTSAASGADSDAENRVYEDLELYLTASHPENEVITRYGREVLDFLERDKYFLRTEDKMGWAKWILRNSFLRRKRSLSQHPIKIANFLKSYGEAAFTAVKEDTSGFRVDTSSGTIEIIPIDKLAELEKIVNHHYWAERATGHSFEWEIEVQSRKHVQVRLYVNAKDRGRFVGNGGFRVRALTTRILNEIGVKANISIGKKAGGDERKLTPEVQ